ncbi:MAG: ABC transporter ATP-binding protein [Nitrospinales bacterium]
MALSELEIKNLQVNFSSGDGDITAVNGISYCLHKGETLAIVGESGSGKTVSALSILRLIPEPPGKIMQGEILFNSSDILKLNSRDLRSIRGKEIAMIFQDPMTALNPVYTIGNQIEEAVARDNILSKKEKQSRVIELLQRVEIPDPEKNINAYPHELSGGMRQRVMIAMALACNPKILIADEPTTALDVIIQAQILDLLNDIQKETGMSIILITHDLGIVKDIAQRTLIMYAGEIVECGTVEQMFSSPLHPYTKGLINSVPKLGSAGKNERLTEIKGNIPTLNHLPTGCPFHPRCPEAMDECKTNKPSLQKFDGDHQVSCLLHEPAAKERAL